MDDFDFDAICQENGGYSGNPQSDPQAAYEKGLADMLHRARETLARLRSDNAETINEFDGGMVVRHPRTLKWVLVVGYGKDNRRFPNCFHEQSPTGKVLPRVFPTAESAANALDAAVAHMEAGGIEADLRAHLESYRTRFDREEPQVAA